jgi:hypothetical protein
MGTLVAWHYPTNLVAGQADHTYVACGNGGKAWSCWGGKTGGRPLRQSVGSTLRADAIAEPDERANINCYLVNGVCHQAANRILLPAKIIVRGAKGYWISEAMFGTYGRQRGVLGFCQATFHRHERVTGDLPECRLPPAEMELREPAVREPEVESEAVTTYLTEVVATYRAIEPSIAAERLEDGNVDSFQARLFRLMIDFKLGSELGESVQGRALIDARLSIEHRRREIEEAFFRHELSVRQFVDAFNELTIELQERSGEILDEGRYRALFEQAPEEKIVIADPAVAQAAYPAR